MFRMICGLGGATYVWVHRHYVLFMRSNKKMNKFLQKKYVNEEGGACPLLLMP